MSFEPLTVALAAQSEQLRTNAARLEWENGILRSTLSRFMGMSVAIQSFMDPDIPSDYAVELVIQDLLDQDVSGWSCGNWGIEPIQHVQENTLYALNKIVRLAQEQDTDMEDEIEDIAP